MDKASDFGSENCRFKSCHDRKSFVHLVLILQYNFEIVKQLYGIKLCKMNIYHLLNEPYVNEGILTGRNLSFERGQSLVQKLC